MTAPAIVNRPGNPKFLSRIVPRTEVRQKAQRLRFFSTVNGAFSFRKKQGSRRSPAKRVRWEEEKQMERREKSP